MNSLRSFIHELEPFSFFLSTAFVSTFQHFFKKNYYIGQFHQKFKENNFTHAAKGIYEYVHTFLESSKLIELNIWLRWKSVVVILNTISLGKQV